MSEIATNAVRHTSGPRLTVRLTVHPERILVHITDNDPDHPPAFRQIAPPDPWQESGRGLLLVRELANRWGVSPTDGAEPAEPAEPTEPAGRSVWFELAAPAPAAAPAAPATPRTPR